MYISEPWTFATDVLLALISFYYARRIAQDPQSHLSMAYRLWVGSFIMIGAAAFQGAIYHGFAHILPSTLHTAFRVGTLWSLSATAFFISLSVLRYACPRKSSLFTFIFGLIAVKSIVFASIAAVQIKFGIAIIDYGSAFVIALVVFLFSIKRSGAKGMILGILVSMIAAAVQTLKIAPSEYFNHNDLYHVIQIAGLYIFYKNSQKLTDKT